MKKTMRNYQIAGNSLEPCDTTLYWKRYKGTRLIAEPNSNNSHGLDNPQPSSYFHETLGNSSEFLNNMIMEKVQRLNGSWYEEF